MDKVLEFSCISGKDERGDTSYTYARGRVPDRACRTAFGQMQTGGLPGAGDTDNTVVRPSLIKGFAAIVASRRHEVLAMVQMHAGNYQILLLLMLVRGAFTDR
jgi:hypothetical protein